MSRRYPDLFEHANSGRIKSDATFVKSETRFFGLGEVLRRMFPEKTAHDVAYFAGISKPQAQRVLKGKQGLALQSVRKLLHQPRGDLLFQWIMNGNAPDWYRELNDGRNIVIAKKEKKLADKRFLEALERGADL